MSTSGSVHRFRCELAWLGAGTPVPDVDVDVADGRIVAVHGPGQPGTQAPSGEVSGTTRLAGLVLPGAANAHSHAFHRALRGRTHGQGGTFWTWRQLMYRAAERLDADRYQALARAVFAEMVLAGFTAVGEFHYLHHRGGQRSAADPNELGTALVAAAAEAGIRLCLLDTCYLAGGIGQPLDGVQERFSDGDVGAWAQRVEDLHRRHDRDPATVIGAAIHSVRAVPPDALPVVAAWAAGKDVPLHVHVSEQPAENQACVAAFGRTPVALLDDAGVLGPRTSAVHATHLTGRDVELLAGSGTSVCLCPTTEADLGDGIGPTTDLVDAGVAITLGTDSHASIDPYVEARRAEWDQRLRSGRRGNLGVDQLLVALHADGQRSLGFPDAGRLAQGARADLVALDLGSVRLAGSDPSSAAAAAVFAANAADVTDVVIDGRHVVRDQVHRLGDVGQLLAAAIADLDLGPVVPAEEERA